jgi:pimeloyl-ACP methyl ester carboxylesterase
MPACHASPSLPRSLYLDCQGFNVHVTEWGDPQAPAVICWHGLARTGRDFDDLARHLSAHWRVVCPDTIGRGLSQWSPAPDRDYRFAVYADIAWAMMQALQIETAHWVGTSMGGAIGMVCAAGLHIPALRGRIQSLVLNDMAPEIASAAVERIKAYAGQPPVFDTVPELEAFFRLAYAPFGQLTDAQWRHLAETSARRLPDGRVTPHYDPAITRQFFQPPEEYALWPQYDALAMPVLMLRGAASDLIERRTLDVMRQRGPGLRGLLQVEEIEGCGHAPALNVPDQMALVEGFLSKAAKKAAHSPAKIAG